MRLNENNMETEVFVALYKYVRPDGRGVKFRV